MNISSDLQSKTSHYIIMGFSLVVGLTWNDTIKHVIYDLFPLESEAIMMRIIYALVLTFVLVLLIKYLPDTSKECFKNQVREKLK